MSVGAVLAQPQRVRRATVADPAGALAEDALALLTRILADPARREAMAPVLEEAFQAAGERMLQRSLAGLERARERLGGWVEEMGQPVQALVGALEGVEDAEQAVRLVQQLLDRATQALAGISADVLRPHVRLLLEVVEQDLGLSAVFIEGEVWALLDDVAARLDREEAQEDTVAREDRRELAGLLRRVKRLLRGRFSFPRLEAEEVADALGEALRRAGVEMAARRAACVGAGLGGAAEAAVRIAQRVPFGSWRQGSVSAAAAEGARDTYCWYPSWLLGKKVWVTADRTRVMKEGETEPLHQGTDVEWFDAEMFRSTFAHPRYTFKCFRPEAMETLAFATAIGADYLETLLHAVSLENGDYASNALNGLFTAGNGTYKWVQKEPMPEWCEWILGRVPLTLGASLEGMHTRVSAGNWFLMWITLLIPDAGEMVIYKLSAGSARDFILSFTTLLNYEGERTAPSGGEDRRPENRKVTDGVSGVFVALSTRLMVEAFPRVDYRHPFASGEDFARLVLLWDLLIGTGFGLLGGFVGTTVAEIVAWAEDWSLLGCKMLKSVPSVWLSFLPNLYMNRDGDTDGGRYNPNGAAFAGYPPSASSPYRLPYASGQTVYVGQGNQGMWSHHFTPAAPGFLATSQVYAYDFSQDAGDEILASRPGTVVDYFDWVPDDQDPGAAGSADRNTNAAAAAASGFLVPGQTTDSRWNFIAIRHDVDDAGNPVAPDPAHDLGPGGAVVTTYAVYGHGQLGSVRAAFAARPTPVAPTNIIGQTVRRGQPILRAGDTGISFHNHLHMHVVPGPAAPPPGTPVAPVSVNAAVTVPFVFSDVPGNGVCTKLNFYTSSTPRVP